MIQRGITVRCPMTDKDYIDLRTEFEREKNFAAVGKEMMRDAVLAESQRRRFDSGIEWLIWLKYGIGVPPVVRRFMSTHFGALDDDYTRACGLYMWTGLAGRMFEPGCQLDCVVALQSKQGIEANLRGSRHWCQTPIGSQTGYRCTRIHPISKG